MKKKKIVFLSVSVGNYNGIFLSQLIKRLNDSVEVYIIHCPQCKGSFDYKRDVPEAIINHPNLIRGDGVNLFDIFHTRKVIKSPDSVITYFIYYRNLDKLLEEISPDIVQTALYFMPYSWQAYRYCARKNIPLLISEEIQREPKFPVTRILNRMSLLVLRKTMLKKASYLISATDMGVDFQGSHLADKSRVVQIPWPVEEEKFIQCKRIESRSNEIRLLSVARLVPYKDFDTMLAAMAKLKENGVPFHFTIKGSGPSEKKIRADISRLGLDGQVEVISKKLDFETMRELYLSSDLLILASIYEPYGMVVPEAMACGCGIIISDTSGTKFMVDPGRNGYIFRTGDASGLAEAIEKSVGMTKVFGEYSRQLMKTRFSKKVILDDYIQLLRKVGI